MDRPPYNDGIAQLDRLDESTKLVSISIGGNDLDFPVSIAECVMLVLQASCEDELGDEVSARLASLVSEHKLDETYKEIRKRAPYARIAVVGYPRWFIDEFTDYPGQDYCALIRDTDQQWLNQLVRDLNREIRAAAQRIGVQYIDIYDVGEGRELCTGQSTLDPFMNGVDIFVQSNSFHPNRLGHELIADAVFGSLQDSQPGESFNILPGQTVTRTFTSSGGEMHVSTQWPGSDVVLALTSPSGRVIERSTLAADVTHEVGPTFESYHIASSEPGVWTATMFGAEVAVAGEETRLAIWEEPRSQNSPPTAAFTQVVTGMTVTVDAAPSSDADGQVVEYLWDFGDGQTAIGGTASHTYTEPGEYFITLAVKDDDGDTGFAMSQQAVVAVEGYNLQLLNNVSEPTSEILTIKAGLAAPITFTLGGNFGLDVLAPGSPSITAPKCFEPTWPVSPTSTAQASGLSYDSATGVYTYTWAALTAGCRELKFTFTDGSTFTTKYKVLP